MVGTVFIKTTSLVRCCCKHFIYLLLWNRYKHYRCCDYYPHFPDVKMLSLRVYITSSISHRCFLMELRFYPGCLLPLFLLSPLPPAQLPHCLIPSRCQQTSFVLPLVATVCRASMMTDLCVFHKALQTNISLAVVLWASQSAPDGCLFFLLLNNKEHSLMRYHFLTWQCLEQSCHLCECKWG